MRPTIGVGEVWISCSSSSKPPEPEPRFAEARALLEVGAGAEGGALVGHHQRPDLRVGVRRGDGVAQTLDQVRTERVAVLLVGQRRGHHAALARDPDRALACRPARAMVILVDLRYRSWHPAVNATERESRCNLPCSPRRSAPASTRAPPEFAENRAAMLEKLAEIDRLLDEAEAGGGPDAPRAPGQARQAPGARAHRARARSRQPLPRDQLARRLQLGLRDRRRRGARDRRDRRRRVRDLRQRSDRARRRAHALRGARSGCARSRSRATTGSPT